MPLPIDKNVSSAHNTSLVDGLNLVSNNITRAIILKARHTNTPIIFTDEHGTLLYIDPNTVDLPDA